MKERIRQRYSQIIAQADCLVVGERTIPWQDIEDVRYAEEINFGYEMLKAFITRRPRKVTWNFQVELRYGVQIYATDIPDKHHSALAEAVQAWKDYQQTDEYKIVEREAIRYNCKADEFLPPEEKVRQYVIRLLTHVLKYPRESIETEFRIDTPFGNKSADIVVFDPPWQHDQIAISIIVECKRADREPTKYASGQLRMYMDSCPNVKYGILAARTWKLYEKLSQGNYPVIEKLPDATGQLCYIDYETIRPDSPFDQLFDKFF